MPVRTNAQSFRQSRCARLKFGLSAWSIISLAEDIPLCQVSYTIYDLAAKTFKKEPPSNLYSYSRSYASLTSNFLGIAAREDLNVMLSMTCDLVWGSLLSRASKAFSFATFS